MAEYSISSTTGFEPVNLIDEEDIAFSDAREDRGKVSRLLQGRRRSGPELDAKLIGDDGRKGRLSQAGRAGEKDMIQVLAAFLRRFDIDSQVLLELLLSNELREEAGPQRELFTIVWPG